MSQGVDLEAPAAPPADGGSADGAGAGGSRGRLRWLLDGLWATLPAWMAGHLIVCLISWHMSRDHPLAKLFMWDTLWYRYIAANGYDVQGGFIHFFPLTPMTAAAVTAVTRVPITIALFGVCWAGALVFGALVHRIVVRETGDRASARRAAWLTQLAPGGYALVMAYTEPLAGVLAAGYFLMVRSAGSGSGPGSTPESTSGSNTDSSAGQRRARRHAWLALGLGFFGGMARPVGLLLAIPGAIEGLRSARREGWRWKGVAGAAAVAA